MEEDVAGIELPEGVGGRDAHDITGWAYTAGFDTGGSAAGRGRLGGDSAAPDGGQAYGPCRHSHGPGGDRMPCPARGGACAGAAMRDAVPRTRDLGGEGR